MIIQRVLEADIKTAAQSVGVRLVILAPRKGKPRSYLIKPVGRRFRNDMKNTCIHGYQAFIAAVMEAEPGALVETSLATYRGRDEWEAKRVEHLARAKAMFEETCSCE